MKDLLPYLADLPFDGLEALTPKPQGDVTLEELQESVGNKTLLDVIPSIIFLPQYSMDYFKEYVQKVLEMFAPNIIVGVSDEVSPNGQMAKLEMMGKIISEFEL